MQTTGMSPFFALFGRMPRGIAEMESPVLRTDEYHGHENVDANLYSMRQAWKRVQEVSLQVRNELAQRQERMTHGAPLKANQVKPND